MQIGGRSHQQGDGNQSILENGKGVERRRKKWKDELGKHSALPLIGKHKNGGRKWGEIEKYRKVGEKNSKVIGVNKREGDINKVERAENKGEGGRVLGIPKLD